MPKGFGIKEQTKDQYIRNFFKNSRAVLSGFPTPEVAREEHSKMWHKKFSASYCHYELNELFNPPRRDLIVSKGSEGISDTTKNTVLCGYNGVWRLRVDERTDKTLDFEIAVFAGNRHRFHPSVIADNICSVHGKRAYDNWRELVKQDIHSLIHLTEAVQSELDRVPWSYTCCDSSARLCEKVGLSTERGIAFMFPSSYK